MLSRVIIYATTVVIRSCTTGVTETYTFVFEGDCIALDVYQKARRGSPTGKYLTCKRWDRAEDSAATKPDIPEDVKVEAVMILKDRVIRSLDALKKNLILE